MMTPLVLDTYHGNEIDDMKAIYTFGIRGIIHKATESTRFKDSKYAARRGWAIDNGLLWGAYHFIRPGNIAAQASFFVDAAKPDATTLLALDYEDKGVSLADVRTFLKAVREATGQRPKLYGGSVLKEKLGKKADPFIATHRLWMPQYGPKAVLPPGWNTYWLWQYTGDGIGPLPHNCPGVTTKNIDLNVFGGVDLATEWVDNLSIV